MSQLSQPARAALNNARRALLDGDRHTARRWAERAAQLSPEIEDPWLFLAATSSPRASVIYLQRALLINPSSPRARQGMHWAVQRLRVNQPRIVSTGTTQPVRVKLEPATRLSNSDSSRVFYYFLAVATAVGLLILFFGTIGGQWLPPALVASKTWLQALAASPTPSSAPTMISTPTSTETLAASPTPTFTFIPTDTLTETPTTTPSLTPTLPTSTMPAPTNTPQPFRPDGVATEEFWIEVDLSQQKLYAHQGDQLLSSFVVSTGKAGTPTVLGSYQVYVKYRSADMMGPGYYLPGVPYVMYFYEGYGLHGTYWHNSFGVPTSHGCINLRTEDARWLFKWVKIGTVVFIHK